MGKRIIANIAASLAKIFSTFLFSLFSSRLLLGYLGEANFGAVAAVTASGVFISFLTVSLIRGIQREVAFNMGAGRVVAAQKMFASALSLFGLLALAAVLTGWLLKGRILGVMKMPEESSLAISWLYDVMVAQIGISIIYAPYRAALEGLQHITVLSLIDIAVSGLNVVLLFALPSLSQHVLFGYGIVQLILIIVSIACTVFYAKKYCAALVNIGYGFSGNALDGVFGITGWSLFGHLNWILRSEGTTFALNVFFGPTLNAGYALALRLHALQNELSFSFIRALQPALTHAVATHDQVRERALTLAASKLPAMCNLVLWIPFLLCPEDIFLVWLGSVPEAGPLFLRLLGAAMIGMSSFGHHMALESRSKLASVTLWVTLPTAIAFAVVCFLHTKYDLPFWTLPLSQLIVGMFLVLIVRPWLHGRLLAISYLMWAKNVFFPYVKCYLVTLIVPLPLWYVMSPGFYRLAVVTSLAVVSLLVAVWRIGLSMDEKQAFMQIARKALGDKTAIAAIVR